MRNFHQLYAFLRRTSLCMLYTINLKQVEDEAEAVAAQLANQLFDVIWYPANFQWATEIVSYIIWFVFCQFLLLLFLNKYVCLCHCIHIHRHPDVKINFNKIKRTLRHGKTKKWPKAPSNCDEINKLFADENLLREFGYTKHEEHPTPFFRTAYKSKDFEHCVFASQSLILRVCK